MASLQRLVQVRSALSLARTRGFSPCNGFIVPRRRLMYRQICQCTKIRKLKVLSCLNDSMDGSISEIRKIGLSHSQTVYQYLHNPYIDIHFETMTKGIQGIRSAIKTARKEFATCFLACTVVPMTGAALAIVLPCKKNVPTS